MNQTTDIKCTEVTGMANKWLQRGIVSLLPISVGWGWTCGKAAFSSRGHIAKE
jgi:hypothetical protein